MASWVVLGVPTVACGTGPVTMMSAAAASKGNSKKAGGLLDWLNGALDKESFSEMDPILQKGEGASAAAPKKPTSPSPAASKSKQSSSGGGGGGGLFGLFGKK